MRWIISLPILQDRISYYSETTWVISWNLDRRNLFSLMSLHVHPQLVISNYPSHSPFYVLSTKLFRNSFNKYSNAFSKEEKRYQRSLGFETFRYCRLNQFSHREPFLFEHFETQFHKTRHLRHPDSSFARSIVPSRKSRSTDSSKYCRSPYWRVGQIWLISNY